MVEGEDRLFVELIIENEVLKPVLSRIINTTNDNIKLMLNEQFSSSNINKNELLNVVYREVILHSTDIGQFDHEDSILVEIAETFLKVLVLPFFAAAVAVFSVPLFSFLLWLRHDHRDNLIGSNRDEISYHQRNALNYLEHVENKLLNMSDQIQENMNVWLNKRKNEFKEKINNYHRLALQSIKYRDEAYKLARKYLPQFTRIECQLVANSDLFNHDGIPPVIEQNTIGMGGFFSVHPTSWGTEQFLVAKKIHDPGRHLNIAYMEAHFHRTITRLNIEHMVPLKYLYKNADEPENLFIIIPRYQTSLHNYLHDHMRVMSIDKTVQIALDIARVVAIMHMKELVHRDVKVSNILLDDNEQVFLADFGTSQYGTDNTTIVGTLPLAPEIIKIATSSNDHQYSYEGSAVDVFSLGVLMYVIAPKSFYDLPSVITKADVNNLDRIPESYRELILRCLNTDIKARPTAEAVVTQLEIINEQVANSKPCLICLDQPRFARCLPCRHKIMCRKCLIQAQQTNPHPICIICKKVYTHTEEDINISTHLTASVPKN